MSSNDAYDQIAIRRPLGSLVGFINISSILFQILIVGIFQIMGFLYLTIQPWYTNYLFYIDMEVYLCFYDIFKVRSLVAKQRGFQKKRRINGNNCCVSHIYFSVRQLGICLQ